MNPLRILLVNGNFRDGSVGGTQTFTESLAQSLTRAGHEVGVLCQAEVGAVSRLDGVRVFRVRPPALRMATSNRFVYWVNQTLAIQNPAVRAAVDVVVSEFRPALCHLQMLRRLTPAVISALRARQLPVVQTLHEPFSLWNFNAYQRQDSPEKLYTKRPPLVSALKHWHRHISRQVQHVCAPSSVILEQYLRDGYFKGIDCSVVPNSVTFEWGDPKLAAERRAARVAREVRFLFLGRLDHYKGVECLLQALRDAKTGELRLDIAGEGVLESRVRQAAAQDARITFHGAVHDERRRDLFERADVLVCPSTWSEAFGLVVAEAYAAGLPVIASDAGALSELVIHEHTGLIVKAASSHELANALSRLCDPALRRQMARAAAVRAELYRPELFLERQLSIYARALAGSPEPQASHSRPTTVSSCLL